MPRTGKDLAVTTSVSRTNKITDMYVNHFNSKNILTGGCGRKVKIFIMKTDCFISKRKG